MAGHVAGKSIEMRRQSPLAVLFVGGKVAGHMDSLRMVTLISNVIGGLQGAGSEEILAHP